MIVAVVVVVAAAIVVVDALVASKAVRHFDLGMCLAPRQPALPKWCETVTFFTILISTCASASQPEPPNIGTRVCRDPLICSPSWIFSSDCFSLLIFSLTLHQQILSEVWLLNFLWLLQLQLQYFTLHFTPLHCNAILVSPTSSTTTPTTALTCATLD